MPYPLLKKQPKVKRYDLLSLRRNQTYTFSTDRNDMSGMKPHIRSQNIGHADLSYLLYDGSGPTVIMLHATGFLPWLWHPIARKLSPSYRILAPYLCNHREGDPEKGSIPWKLLAEDLTIFCERLHIEAPLVVGHSMGATVGTLAHALFGVQSKGMVLIEPVFLPRRFYGLELSVDDSYAAQAMRRKNSWRDTGDAREYLKSRDLFKNWDEEVLELYLRYGMQERKTGTLELVCSPRQEAALFTGARFYDPWPHLPEISCPVLVVEGEQSEVGNFIDFSKVAATFRHGRHTVVKDAGHLLPMERPEETADIISDFFDTTHGNITGQT
jgi:lipase